MDNNGTGMTPGGSGDGSQGNPAGGNSDVTPSQPGTPTNQGGTQTDPRNAELERLRQEVRTLNRSLVESRRKGSQGKDDQGQDLDFQSPEGQYGIALQLATGELRGKMEEVISLYPELTPEQVQMIRGNPWAFASLRTMQACDWEQAAIEIETQMSKWAESGKPITPQNGQGGKPTPASVNGNPAPEAPNGETEPGTDEDENPWTMPMDKLKKQKDKAVAVLQKDS